MAKIKADVSKNARVGAARAKEICYYYNDKKVELVVVFINNKRFKGVKYSGSTNFLKDENNDYISWMDIRHKLIRK